jgi:hypothetical protein
MAAKKNLNNPNKPDVKVRSTKGPAASGGKSTKLQQTKGGAVSIVKPGQKPTNVKPVTPSKGKSDLQIAKRMIKSGEGTPSSGAQKSTKKGTQLEDNKWIKGHRKAFFGTKNPETLLGKKRSAETYKKNSEGKSNYGRK